MNSITSSGLCRMLRAKASRFGLSPGGDESLTVRKKGEDGLVVRLSFEGRQPMTPRKFESIIKKIAEEKGIRFKGIRGGTDFRANALTCTLLFAYEHVCVKCCRRITGKLKSVEILKDSVYICHECAGKVLFKLGLTDELGHFAIPQKKEEAEEKLGEFLRNI